ncbi:MAG: hypothetical protein WCP32_03975 [Bacteroidota bacterium]
MRLALLFIIGSLLLTSACRKKDIVDYVPVTPVDPTNVPPLFDNKQPTIMSNFEISRNESMQGHLLTKSLNSIPWEDIGEGVMSIFGIGMGIFDIVTWIDGYKEYQEEMKQMSEMNSQLDKLHVQDSLLGAGITKLVMQLNYSTALIMNQINNTAAMGYISDIQTRFGNQDHNGLRYYSLAGAKYQNHVAGYDSAYMSGPLHASLTSFENINTTTPYLDNDFNGLYLLICPVIPMDTSCLMTFAKVLVSQSAMRGMDTTDSKDFIMNNYLLLENYFFTLINYQFQAATIKANVLISADTLQAQSFILSAVAPAILAETDMFLQAARYLLLNVADYRSNARWAKDIKFSAISMAPNPDIFDALSRAQFRVTELYQALDAPCEVVWGSIITPKNYCSSPPLVQIGSSPSLPPGSPVQEFKGIIPYTRWSGSQATFGNTWDIYNYNLPAGSGSGAQNISVNPTWPHLSQGPGYGTITPLWYNPRNPAETSTVQTDSCFVQFASFSLAWQWGTLMTDYLTTSVGLDNGNMYANFESYPGGGQECAMCGNPKSSDSMKAPFIAQWHTNQTKWENVQKDAQRYYGSITGGYSPFHYSLQANMQPYSSGAEFVYDQVTVPVSIPGIPSNGGFSMFASYSTTLGLNPWPSSLKNVNFKIGSTIIDCKDSCGCSTKSAFMSNGDVVNVGQIGGSGIGSSLSQGSGWYHPGFQYWFTINNSGVTTSTSVQVYIDAQIVFTGYAGF